MRKLGLSLFALVMLFAAVGCDGGGDDPNAAEVFIGNWRLSNLLLNGQDVTALLLASATVEIDFEAMAFVVTITTDTPPPSTILGSYTLNESLQTIRLVSNSFENPITIRYTINNDNQITLDTDDVGLFIGLTGIDPEELLGLPIDAIRLVVQRTG